MILFLLSSMYSALKNSGSHDLSQFLKIYQPPITEEHHTCVGLAMTLLHKLGCLDPHLLASAYIVSCDELVDDIEDVVSDEPEASIVQKEHVMVACKLNIAGRQGVFILDPGYHVARVVTVMADQQYPHTGKEETQLLCLCYVRSFSFYTTDIKKQLLEVLVVLDKSLEGL